VPQVQVQAILCWSEYYNGKWQPTKTSDVNLPTDLRTAPATGPLAFDRSTLQISFSEEESALRLNLGYSSFLLYNTHSLPQREEDIGNPTYEARPGRYMSPGVSPGLSPGRLAMDYDPGIGNDNNLNRDVLNYQTRARTAQPVYPLKNPWDAPFFFEDSHHVFYVTTKEQPVTVFEWNGYFPFVVVFPPELVLIPSMVFEQVKIVQDRLGPVITNPHVGVMDTAQIKRFVSEDAYIKKGISATGTVLFGGTEIGAAGNRNSVQQR
jgi:hypothetical protein